MKVNTNPKYRYQVVYNNDEIILDTDTQSMKIAEYIAK